MSTPSPSPDGIASDGLVDAPSPATLDPLRDRLRSLLFGGPESVTRVGRFVVLRALGSGGMGRVYAAYDEQLRREVALKVLHSDMAASPHHQERLIREAQALARLTHPHVVTVHEAGQVDGRVFLAMELVPGVSLRRWQEPVRSWREVLERYLDAGRGLAAAHEAGLTHRDFKPDNVLVGDDGRVRVADFGLALAEDHDLGPEVAGEGASGSETSVDARADAGAERLTATGARLGTLAYMAPEQRRGEPVGPASDQYAFCVALHEGLFGERPSLGSDHALVRIGGPSKAPGRGRVPRWLVEALRRGLAREPAQRHPDMNALIEGLVRRLRRRRWGAGAAVGGVLLVGWLARPAAPEPCATAGDLAEVWGAQPRRGVQEAFEATGLPYASRAAQRTIEQLDDYADQWAQARVQACEATHVRHVQSSEALDLRTACLDDRRRDLSALVDALRRADALGVTRASQAVAGLPSLLPCEDLTALRREVDPPASDDRAEVEAVRDALADARSDHLLGDHVGAQQRLRTTRQRADVLGYEPLRAEVMQLYGTVAGRRGELVEAEEALLSAADLAEGHRHDEVAAAAWRELGYLATAHLHDPQRGERWLRRARAAVQRTGERPLDQAHVLEIQGNVAMLRHRYDEAQRAFEHALRLRERARGPAHREVASTRAALANSYTERGALAEAEAIYTQVIAQLVERLGPEHPDVGAQRFNLAIVYQARGQLARAAEALAATAQSYRVAYGERSTRLVPVLTKQAEVEEHRGRLDAALDYAERARALLDQSRSGGAASPSSLLQALNVVGILQYRQGRYAESLDTFSRALAVVEQSARRSPLDQGLGHSNVGDVLVALGREPEAEPHYRAALTLMRSVEKADPSLLAYPLRGLGQVALARGAMADAVGPLREALAIRREHPGDRHELATTLWALARAEHALAAEGPPGAGAASRVRAATQEARQLFEAADDPTAVAEIDAWTRRLGLGPQPPNQEDRR